MMSMRKVSRGSGFKGVLKYNLAQGKGEIVGGNMSSTDINALAREFSAIANLRSDIKKPVWHQALRLPEGEVLTTEKFTAIADSYMKKMGLENHQYTLILDNMANGQHVHIVANRIGLDGKVYLGKNENLKSTQVIRDLEIDHGLQQSPRPESGARRAKAKPSKNEIEMSLRTCEKAPKLQIQKAIDIALQNTLKLDLSAFKEELLSQGIQSHATVNKNGLVGFRFALEDSDVWFKGSSLGKNYSKAKLLGRGLIDDSRKEQVTASERVAKPSNTSRASDSEAIRREQKTLRTVTKKLTVNSKFTSEKTKPRAEQKQQNVAYLFFSRNFVANADFASYVRFHDVKTNQTKIDTGMNQGVVTGCESKAISDTGDAQKDADLLIHYSKLRGWSSVTTTSNNAEFLYEMREQTLTDSDIKVTFTDEQLQLIDDYECMVEKDDFER